MRDERPQSANEELANALTHGAGLGLSLLGLVLLLVFSLRNGSAWSVVSCSVYGSTLIVLYASSTVYHALRHSSRWKTLFNAVDHAAIYLLVAGTYTPFVLGPLRGPWGWSLFGVVWGVALAGIVFQCLFLHRFRAVSVSSYVALGWLLMVALPKMIQVLPPGGLSWIVAGGLFYTTGIVFYVQKNKPYRHAIWHLFVLGGSLCHFFGVLWFVLR